MKFKFDPHENQERVINWIITHAPGWIQEYLKDLRLLVLADDDMECHSFGN